MKHPHAIEETDVLLREYQITDEYGWRYAYEFRDKNYLVYQVLVDQDGEENVKELGEE